MIVNIKRLVDAAKPPTKAYEHAAAFDVYATSKEIVEKPDHGYIEYGIGWAMEIPEGYVGKLFARSSVSKTGLILANHVGIIDPDYRGEVRFRYKWIPNTAQYNVGDKCGQIRIEKTLPVTWKIVDELSDTERGEGGFGSSGN